MTDLIEASEHKSDQQVVAGRSVLRRLVAGICRWMRTGIALVTLIGILIRLTVQDYYLIPAMCYYATPLPLLILGAIVSGLASWRAKHRWRILFWLVTCCLLLTAWGKQDWRTAKTIRTFEQQTDDEFLVMFWNVARRQDLTPAVAEIRKLNPDVIAMVEVQGKSEHWKQFWKEQLPEYDCSALGGSIYLLSKGRSGESTPYNLKSWSIARQIQVVIDGIDLEFLIVDIHADPRYSRRLPLAELTKICDALEQERLIILGDFNTPPDSVFFNYLRKNHTLAFEKAGAGYACTWPIPLPIMQLDHIWVNKHVQALDCRHHYSRASDHGIVTARIRASR